MSWSHWRLTLAPAPGPKLRFVGFRVCGIWLSALFVKASIKVDPGHVRLELDRQEPTMDHPWVLSHLKIIFFDKWNRHWN